MPDANATRRARLAAGVATSSADAALITHLINVRYLTGIASSNAAVLVVAGDPPSAVLATDTRYALAAQRQCPDLELVIERNVAAGLLRLAVSRGLRRILFEAHAMTVEQHATLTEDAEETDDAEAIDDTADADEGASEGAGVTGGVELAPLGRRVEELRMVKDEQEIAAIVAACGITCAAFDQVLPSIGPGMTEKQLAVALERGMVDLGADAPGFATIVATGPNGAIPHHTPTDRPIARGELVTMDFGACYGGYHADMTRTIAVGEPAGWQRDLYALVAAAQLAGVAALRPGVGVAQVDAAARDLIAQAGHREHFGHGLGHGIGLEIHEAPLMHHDGTGTLKDRVPITVEPGVYLEGVGGVRIEDTVVVRAGGDRGELLTTTTKELLVV